MFDESEFWYSAVHWSPADPKATDLAKKIIGWSFMNVWMGRHAHNGDIIMLITRCPVAIKRSFLQQPTDDFELYLRYPMTLHLYFLRNNAQNHWETLKGLMLDLHEEVSIGVKPVTVLHLITVTERCVGTEGRRTRRRDPDLG